MLRLDYAQRDFWRRLDRFACAATPPTDLQNTVRTILEEVRAEGDGAVLRYTEKFDRVRLSSRRLRVPEEELAAAWAGLDRPTRRALQSAARCLRDFHRRIIRCGARWRNPHGAMVGERYDPIRRVGINIPAGQVPLVSTVLHTAIPAALAGVPEIAVVTPPGPDGSNHPTLLAALHLCGVREVYRMGGIQAMAALAFGTRTVPAVDKLFGPGNQYVTEAKRQLFGFVGVDLLPGPSEVMIIADGSADPSWTAADLLAQAEHGSGKERVFLVTTQRETAEAILAEADRQRSTLRQAEAIGRVWADGLLVARVPDLAAAAAVANRLAPEHLELHVAPGAVEALAATITTAGSILLGAETPTVLGDFTAGPSHTLPTGRTGRFFSGLRVEDFQRRTSLIRYTRAQLSAAAPTVAAFAALEQLDAHGRSLAIRQPS